MGRSGARERQVRARFFRPARARAPHPEGARVGAHRHRDAPGGRARRARRNQRGKRARRNRCAHRSHPRKKTLDARSQIEGCERRMKRSYAGWIFVAPALMAIAAFFVVPVVAALAMSFTDFDIYALADIANLRFVGLEN